MKDHFKSWSEFANHVDLETGEGRGLGLCDEEIVFVSGTLKTTEWIVAAFHGSMYRGKEGAVSGQFGGSVGSLGLSVRIADEFLPTSHYRAGPPCFAARAREEGRLLHSSDVTPAAAPPDRNQCLFIHYYKMKRRIFWKRPMRASAGPHNLPPGPDNTGQDDIAASGGPSAYEFESEPFRDDVRPSMFIESTGC